MPRGVRPRLATGRRHRRATGRPAGCGDPRDRQPGVPRPGRSAAPTRLVRGNPQSAEHGVGPGPTHRVRGACGLGITRCGRPVRLRNGRQRGGAAAGLHRRHAGLRPTDLARLHRDARRRADRGAGRSGRAPRRRRPGRPARRGDRLPHTRPVRGGRRHRRRGAAQPRPVGRLAPPPVAAETALRGAASSGRPPGPHRPRRRWRTVGRRGPRGYIRTMPDQQRVPSRTVPRRAVDGGAGT